jgi:hypothetical protein
MQKKTLSILVLPLLFVGCGSRTPPVQAANMRPLGTDDPSNTDSPIIIADSSTGPIIVEGGDKSARKTLTDRGPGYFSISNELFKLNGPAQLMHSKGNAFQGAYHTGTFEVLTPGSTFCFDLSRVQGWSLFFNSDTKIGSVDKETIYLANADMTGSSTHLKFMLDQQNGLALTRAGGPLTSVLLSTDAQGNGNYAQSFPPTTGNYTIPNPGAWQIRIHYCKGGGACGPACQ